MKLIEKKSYWRPLTKRERLFVVVSGVAVIFDELVAIATLGAYRGNFRRDLLDNDVVMDWFEGSEK